MQPTDIIEVKNELESQQLFKVSAFKKVIERTKPHKHDAYFLSEGVQNSLFSDKLGSGRFEKIGFPNPEFLGPFVGVFEILCGFSILIGLATRMASIPLIIIMLVAIASTKAEVLANDGYWEMKHGSRTDWSMLLGSIFLLIKGDGRWSIDQRISS